MLTTFFQEDYSRSGKKVITGTTKKENKRLITEAKIKR